MCLGIPMRIVTVGDGRADCQDRDGGFRDVVTLLLDKPQVGDWVLVHLDNAMRILDEDEADQISDALQALNAVLHGDSFEHLFADLIDREPELPEAHRAQPSQKENAA
ncbi:HypC/HybG/HupF family hydrogenase formation chaperone [Magnetovibrio sp.]|uniref:HypC/HybG/HupF family hydrogenase formation chaperone n=1 Tax=Magnetovibrio sp. TaxID=2024836 RepID=UPI002F94FBB4